MMALASRAATTATRPAAAWLVAIGLVFGVAAPVSARSVTAGEFAGLSEKVRLFEAAFAKADFGQVVDILPKRLLTAMSEKYGTTVDELRAKMIATMAKATAQMVFESVVIDVQTAQPRELADGEPFFILPTSLKLLVQDKRYAIAAHTVALIEEEDWVLVRLNDDAMIELFRKAYPLFAGVEFPRETVEVLEH